MRSRAEPTNAPAFEVTTLELPIQASNGRSNMTKGRREPPPAGYAIAEEHQSDGCRAHVGEEHRDDGPCGRSRIGPWVRARRC